MTAIAALLASIPATVWTGIVGAILALSGVLLSNRSNTARLRLQLEHDAKEKARERVAALRRDVYLRAVEELVKANAHLAAMPSLDPTKVNIGDGLQQFFAAAARLQLVAEPKTTLLVNRLVGEYGELLVDILAQLMPAHAARSDILLADQHYSSSQSEVTRILGEMARLNESGKPDGAAIEALRSSFEFHQTQCAQYAAERDSAWLRFNAANVSFQRALLERLRELAPKQVPVMIELRRDLGLGTDLDELEAQMRQQFRRMEERITALLATLRVG